MATEQAPARCPLTSRPRRLRRPALRVLGLLAAFVTPLAAAIAAPGSPEPPRPPDGFAYHGHRDLLKTARALATGAGSRYLTVETIGRSALGREIMALVVADRSTRPDPAFRPGLLAVGNVHGDEVLGGEVALELARRLVRGAISGDVAISRLLAQRAVYIIPRPNPDGSELLFGKPAQAQPLVFSSGHDDDRDHLSDEDPPDDLDADGDILQMRIASHHEAAWVVEDKGDADNDGRLLRKVDSTAGERPTWHLVSEGLDDDRDERDNEDGPWSTDIDRNFPIAWRPRYQSSGAGRFPMESPEAKALADFVLSHANIAAALTWHSVGPQGGPHAVASGEIKPEGDDEDLYEVWSERYKTLTGQKDDPQPFHHTDGAKAHGSLQDWLYGGLGIFSWTLRLFTEPPAPETTEKADAEAEAEAEEAPPMGRRWLLWDDQIRGGKGFLPWRKLDHPKYDGVEVGGWRPLEARNPPLELGRALVDQQLTFALALLDALPEARIAEVAVEPLDGDLYRVEVVVENAGRLPLPTRMATKVGRGVPTVLQAAPGGGDRIILGRRRQVVGRLDGGGGRERVTFIMRAERGGETPLRLLLSSPRGGVDGKEIWVGKEF